MRFRLSRKKKVTTEELITPYVARLRMTERTNVDGTKFGLIMGDVMNERHRQDELRDQGRFEFTCADEGLSNADRLACVNEEIGEVAREILTLKSLVHDRPRHEQPNDITKLHNELVQVIALCVAWLESPGNSIPLLKS
jgi:hypothetical protein